MKEIAILVRVGISFISVQQVCANAEAEIHDFGFERVCRESKEQWDELLGRVQVDPTDVQVEMVQLFYSSVGHQCCFDSFFGLLIMWPCAAVQVPHRPR